MHANVMSQLKTMARYNQIRREMDRSLVYANGQAISPEDSSFAIQSLNARLLVSGIIEKMAEIDNQVSELSRGIGVAYSEIYPELNIPIIILPEKDKGPVQLYSEEGL